jgi:hypothetical protein
MEPYATGDPIAMKWGPKTDRGLYGSSYVGFFGGIIRKTNDEKILQLDCLETDFFHDKAYPTYLYFNPYDSERNIGIDVGPARHDLYDTAGHGFLKKGVSGLATFDLAGDQAAVVVITPENGTQTRESGRLSISGVVVDYHYPM